MKLPATSVVKVLKFQWEVLLVVGGDQVHVNFFPLFFEDMADELGQVITTTPDEFLG